MGRLFSSSAGIIFNGGSCLFQRFPRSPPLLYTIRYVFIFAVVFWGYNVCMLWLILINVDNSSLFTRLYGLNSVLFKLSIWLLFFIFFWKRCLSLPCARFVENWSNRSSGVQIPWDICTRFGCCLYSTEVSWIIKHVIFIGEDITFLAKDHLVFHWCLWCYVTGVERGSGGKGKERGIGGLSAFSPSHPLFPPATWAIICQSPCFMARLSKTPAVIWLTSFCPYSNLQKKAWTGRDYRRWGRSSPRSSRKYHHERLAFLRPWYRNWK